MNEQSSKLHGVMAEFETPEQLIEATEKTRAAGFAKLDAYAPYPVEGLSEALGLKRTWVPQLTLLGGILGGCGGFGLQYFTSVIAYPLNIGGRPLNSWPAFIPVTFETTVLGAAIFAVFGMMALNKLPQPYHPVFNVARFAARASSDRFFLCIEADGEKFDAAGARKFLEGLKPASVAEVLDE
jgi:hypothetical protein